jgi:meso-butanediol dehydrogenase/(S,S)-butanediol dehydrogenase/diacetyl reductase
MDLNGKVALVTGAGRGIGRAMALGLAAAGADVAVADIARPSDGATPYALSSPGALDETARLVERAGRRSVAIPADVTSADDVARMMGEVEKRLGGLDILVANAGVIAASPVVAMDEAQWDRIFAVNVKGVFLCARAAIPLLASRGGGRIVNIASIAGKTGRAGLVAYCASKAAVISMTQGMAEELGPMNITVNAICPGFVHTAMFTEILGPLLGSLWDLPPREAYDRFIQQSTFLRRDQRPEDIAEAAVYLCRAENVTGITLTVAGGGEVH